MPYSTRIYSDMIDDLVRDLSGRSDVRRSSAVERCGGLPEDLLLEIISRLLVQYHKQAAWRWAAFLVGAIGLVSFTYLLEGNALFIYGLLGLAVGQHIHLITRHTGRSLQALLQSSEDKRLIPILLLRYTSHDGASRRPQHTRMRDFGLSQLLPYVVESDEEMWTSKMRARLAAMLRSPFRNVPMTLSVLQALSAIGDETALPAIVPLAEANTSKLGSIERRKNREQLYESAARCVCEIRRRADQRQQNAELLRACAAEVPLQASLPRAVEKNRYTAISELVRSVGRQSEPQRETGE